eukprot:NODE_203_length_14950_cov_0.414450.p8 type:complete len:221 gc:universal NODE_203_length_14950_cov_0.414450:10717-11379(+)
MNKKTIAISVAVGTLLSIVHLARYYYSKKQKRPTFDTESVCRDVMLRFNDFFPNTLSIPQPNKFTIIPFHQLFLSKNSNHFIHSTLRKSDCLNDMIYVYPVEMDQDAPKSMIVLIKLGKAVDGYYQITHGGLTAAICDDMFGALFFKSQVQQLDPNGHMKNGVTANLNIDYRKPVVPGKWIIWVGCIHKVENRKTFLLCKVLNLDSEILAEGSCLFITPK